MQVLELGDNIIKVILSIGIVLLVVNIVITILSIITVERKVNEIIVKFSLIERNEIA